jgi:hypothetical protein
VLHKKSSFASVKANMEAKEEDRLLESELIGQMRYVYEAYFKFIYA